MTRIIRSKAAPAVIAGAGVVCAAIVHAKLSDFPPFCIGFGYVFIALLFMSFRVTRGRYLIYNLAFVFFSLAVAEYWFFLAGRSDTHYEGPYIHGYYQDDAELGYSIKPGKRRVKAVKKFNDGRTIYEVAYSMDEFGLRETPDVASKDSVFFFGCSFAFGEGVSDDESLPYRYATISGLRTRNFGLPGYGPHQMLRALETNRPKLLGVPESPTLVVYIALPTHLDRAAGRAFWDPFGPRYEVKNGKAEYVGAFSDRRKAQEPLRRIAGYSYIAKRLATLKSKSEHQRDRERLHAIIRKSRDLVAAKYGAPFLVVMWDVRDSEEKLADMNWLAPRLKEEGIPVIRLSESMPNLGADEFYIPFDGHPNGKALAVVANIIHVSSATTRPPANKQLRPSHG